MRVRHRLLLILSLAGLVGSVLVAFGAVTLTRSALRARFVERIGVETGVLAAWVRTLDRTADLQQFARRAGAELGARVSLIDAGGTVIADSSVEHERLETLDNHLNRPEIESARIRGFGQSLRVSGTTHVSYFYSARRVGGGGPVEYVRIALPARQVAAVQAAYAWLMVGVVLLAMLVLVALSYAAVRRLSRPVERLSAAVDRWATAEVDLRRAVPPAAGRELNDLSRAIERMRRRLLDKIEAFDAERDLLSSVVGAMREGLLLVDSDRRVRLANTEVRRIVDLAFDPVGHVFEEVIREPRVLHAIDAVLDGGDEVEEASVRVPGSDRVFRLYVTPIGWTAGAGPRALALFFDITRLERLERTRRDFVANVSHELRTPLTSIKAFVENLLDGGLDERENARKFLQIVRRHADRMSALIEDLTDLSLIETGAVVLERRPVDAGRVAREVLEQLRPLAIERGIETRIELPTPFPVLADRRRLEQMLTNLVNNAIKFNRDGGQIVLRGERGPAGVALTVEDTGIGIPADSLNKVFQRFFQLERHRSRAQGGTGLGLSIVKHLMRLHGGQVRVDSELGRGSTFRLEFPAAAPDGGQVPAASAG